MAEFTQEFPELSNPHKRNKLFQSILKFLLPESQSQVLGKELEEFGQRILEEVEGLGCEALNQLPEHIPFDPWGRRIDEIKVSEAWKELDRFSAKEGLVAIGYERNYGEHSRIHQFARLFLFHPSSAFYSCPLAMTDGAARVLELFGSSNMVDEPLKHLISRDPQQFWTSGQWMTEKEGGSDVGRSSTEAKVCDGHYELYGKKWFSSAITSQMALALARIEGDPDGSRGLSLFYLPMRNKDGKLNGVEILRLKDKLGTKALPTAEIELKGSRAYLVGEKNRGVKTVTTMLNITRLYNAVCAVGQAQRTLDLATDYSRLREAFGAPLIHHPLHVETLAALKTEFYPTLLMTFKLLHLLGKDETGTATSEDQVLLRLLTPVIKLDTAKLAVTIASEGLEAFGGAGYVEDTGIPLHLRDAQVFPIWEGTTNVLSLDLLRVMRDPETIKAYITDVQQRLEACLVEDLKVQRQICIEALNKLKLFIRASQEKPSEFWQAGSRDLALSLARLYKASLLLEITHKNSNSAEAKAFALMLKRLCATDLMPLAACEEERRKEAQVVAEI